MNIVVIVDDMGVFTYDKWSAVKKNHNLDKKDFVKHGDDYITHFEKEDYNVSQDIKLLETVATQAVFGKQKIDWLTAAATCIVTLIGMSIFFG